ncbi:MAG: hypothetical protein LBI42_04990 [Chitinispirillales bacterium]|jgi:hypothetical protein|nr:hypothetical protein [Chitinispirillales bacterium]
MDIINVFEKSEALLPILIFVIWVIISVLGAANKGKKRSPQPAPSSGGSDSGSESTGISDELRRTLDVIFGTSTESSKPRGTQNENIRKTPAHNINEKKIPQKTLEKRLEETMPKNAKRTVLAAAMIAEHRERSPLVSNISADEAAKGVVWSEILQPPVSIRSFRW